MIYVDKLSIKGWNWYKRFSLRMQTVPTKLDCGMRLSPLG